MHLILSTWPKRMTASQLIAGRNHSGTSISGTRFVQAVYTGGTYTMTTLRFVDQCMSWEAYGRSRWMVKDLLNVSNLFSSYQSPWSVDAASPSASPDIHATSPRSTSLHPRATSVAAAAAVDRPIPSSVQDQVTPPNPVQVESHVEDIRNRAISASSASSATRSHAPYPTSRHTDLAQL